MAEAWEHKMQRAGRKCRKEIHAAMLGDAAQLAPLGKLAQRGDEGIRIGTENGTGGRGRQGSAAGRGASGCEWQCGGCASEKQPLSDEAGGGRVHGQGSRAVRVSLPGARCGAAAAVLLMDD